jgi:hypothetical protein
MSLSYPYNVVVTKDPRVAEKLFFDNLGRNSFNDAFSRLTDEEKQDSLIVSPRTNNNFISLTMDFPKGGLQHKFVVLKMIETNDLLEYFTVSKTGVEELILQKLRKSIKLGRTGPEIVDMLRKVRPSFYFSIGVGDNINEWSGPYLVELIDVNFTITSDNVREVELMFSPMLASQLVFTNKLFNDTKLFQHNAVFDSQFKNNNEVEASVSKNYKFDKKRKKFKTSDARKKYEQSIAEGNETIESAKTVSEIPYPSIVGGWNFVIRDLLRRYLSKISDLPLGNILVLMDDDFDFISNNSDFTTALLYNRERATIGETEFRSGKVLPIGIAQDIANKSKFNELVPLSNTYDIYRSQLNSLGLRASPTYRDGKKVVNKDVIKATRTAEKIIQQESTRIKRFKKDIAEACSTILQKSDLPDSAKAVIARGLSQIYEGNIPNLSEYNPRVVNLTNVVLDSFNEYRVGGFEYKSYLKGKIKELKEAQDKVSLTKNAKDETVKNNTITESEYRANPDILSESTKTKFVDLSELRLTIGKKITQEDVKGNTLVLLRPLYDIAEALRGEAEGKPNDFTIFEENNYKILKLLKDNNLIDDSSKSILVFGREKIIEEYLYPENSSLPSQGLVSLGYEKFGADLPPTIGPGGYVQPEDDTDPWDDYVKSFMTIFDYSITRTSSFKEKIDLGPFNNTYKSLIKDGSLVFMSNTKNANVLSLSFDSSPYKQLLLDVANESAFKVMDEALNTEQVVSNDIFESSSIRTIIEYSKKAIANNEDALKNQSKTIPEVLGSLSNEAREDIINILLDDEDLNVKTNQASLLDIILQSSLSSNGLKRRNEDGNNLAEQNNILRNMAKYIVTANVKTLPFFNNIDSFNRPAFLFGISNYVIGSKLNRIQSPSFFTNPYTVIGYKHVIQPTQAYSEFSLVGNGDVFGTQTLRGGIASIFNIDIQKIREDREKEKEN